MNEVRKRFYLQSLLQAESEMLRNAQKRTAVEWNYETDMSERNEEQKRKFEVT